MGITEYMVQHIMDWLHATGYAGVAGLMALESMVAPVPSEAVMPPAGCLVFEGTFSMTYLVLFSTIGSLIGSLISYYMGYFGGRPFVTRFGRFLLLNLHDLEVTERFFHRHGGITVFIARFVPVIRHLISIPAGTGRMALAPFCLYTVVGAGCWNWFLAYMGVRLRENWELVGKYNKQLDLIVLVGLAAAAVWFVRAHLRQMRATPAAGGE